jgi:ParB/RepB/Spo0J family partition protein
MTSGEFHSCPIDSITVTREARQRRDLQNIPELADSISRLGLIHPLVVTRGFHLVSGERRLTACRSLGWTHVAVQFIDEADPKLLHRIELEENIKRQDITWQDRATAIQAYHELCVAENPAWLQAQTAESIGIVQQHVSNNIAVAKALTDPAIAAQPTFSTALNMVQRQNSRRTDAELASFGVEWTAPIGQSILCARFEDWVRTYEGPKFNLIHCDFPYGIGFDKMGSQAGSSFGRYSDDHETYTTLLRTLSTALDIFAEESCHIIFWFSMHSYDFTFKFLTERAGLSINPFPLIWVKSDNIGIIPDPNRGPRRIYETAFFGSRGDRKIVRSKSNAFAGPTTGLIHPHEKSQAMLEYFFEMLVDEHTTLFDPTAGSGSALRAAEALGAKRVLGLEADEEFARLANIELEKSR